MKNDISKNILGAHVSIAGGIASAFLEAEKIGCQAMQIFTKNSNQWAAKKLSGEEIDKFKQEAKRTQIIAAAHDSYLINLASNKSFIYNRSVEALRDEMIRCEQLEIPFLVMHPGSHLRAGEEVGIKKIAEGLNMVLNRGKTRNLMQKNAENIILLETTAGQGTNLGYKFEQLAEIRNLVEKKDRIGFCLDTCHVFAAGYDLRIKEAYDKTIAEFDKILGLENLFIIHINDSKKEFGSRVDRHEHIGKGYLGEETFRILLGDKRLLKIPKIVETPKDIRIDDLDVLRKLEIHE